MRGHVGQVRSISVEPERGELLVSGGEDGTVRVWMMDSGRCIKVGGVFLQETVQPSQLSAHTIQVYKVAGPVTSVAFCPIGSKSLVAVAYEGRQVGLVRVYTQITRRRWRPVCCLGY